MRCLAIVEEAKLRSSLDESNEYVQTQKQSTMRVRSPTFQQHACSEACRIDYPTHVSCFLLALPLHRARARASKQASKLTSHSKANKSRIQIGRRFILS